MTSAYPASLASGSTAPAVATATNPLQVAEDIVKEMEELEDYYFGSDKKAKMERAAAQVVECADQVLSPASVQRKLRIRAFYLKGRAASLLQGDEQKAIELLSKAVKLDPQCLDAWNTLGEVYWNLQEFSQAQQHFEQAIQLCGSNSVSLRSLSMVLRAVEGKSDGESTALRRCENYVEALKKAKEAVQLDTLDPLNWETLGNSYIGDFFVNARRPDEINRALIAYQKAEAAYEKQGKHNPTLQLNRGMAAKYIEDYDLALKSFKKAHDIGAATAAEEGQRVVELVQRLASYADKKGGLKVNRLKELKSNFPSKPRSCPLKDLVDGTDIGVSLAGRVVQVVDRKGEVPVIVVCCDSAGEFFALSIYNAEIHKVAEVLVPMKSVLFVQNAKYKQISVAGPAGKQWSYPSIRVGNPSDVTVHGFGSLGVASVRSVFSCGAERVEVAPGSNNSGDKTASAAQDDAAARSCEAPQL